MEILFYNAKVYLERGEFAEAVLVKKGLISKVGTSEKLLKVADSDCKKIDCHGKTIIPGLNDSHMHLLVLGESLQTVKLTNSKSVDEIIVRCRKFIKENPELSKNGVFAIGWNQDLFEGDKGIPNRHDADKISTEIPIILRRVCGHLMVSNTKAIEMLGIDGNSEQFEGGTFEIGEDGYPNGVFTENACRQLRKVIPEFSLEDRARMAVEAMKHAVSFGVTSVQSNDVGAVVLGDKDRYFKMFCKIYEEGKGLLRYHHQITFQSPEELRNYAENGELAKGNYPEDSWVTLGPLKLFKDGSLGARTAMLENDYVDDPGNRGEERFDEKYIEDLCRTADENGIQIATHVIGDAATNSVMRTYEKLIKDGKNPLRHALIHCQITNKTMLENIAKNNILVMYQPIFLDYDMHIVESRCGKELASTSYAFNTLDKLGGKISYGTDCPVEGCNPFPNIYCAVTRKDLKGNPEEGFYPEECVDIYTAVDAYTEGSAYAQFMENKKGRIKEGFYADMVILDKDIFTVDSLEIKDIKPLLTMVGGKIVYEKK
ncbi:amidohydrolase [Fusobacterium sp.]|uniref:amidohydrolase n=1 Tax=Fusobacterium sp. TaxID=68766 RepID=UPI0028FEF22E|nr:amidohydrolase [Fusobacterium sp.]MDU1910191.1 amidohydrolase [Fusobacterium sp.]